jgi:hypothetical protein
MRVQPGRGRGLGGGSWIAKQPESRWFRKRSAPRKVREGFRMSFDMWARTKNTD